MRRRPVGAISLAAALLLGGGASLAAGALLGGSAGADTSNLGGFTVNGLAEAYTAQYEQPNFPLPATPTLEFDEGYAATSDNYGPSGSATASTFYPGQVVANAGPQLALLVPGVPLPPAPTWPIQAVTDYPQSPNTDTLDEPGVNMDATSGENGSTATSTVGDDASAAGASGTQASQAPPGSGNPFASTSSLFGIADASGTSTSSTTDTSATATATATDSGISILGGFINIGAVTSTATATSDGTTGTLSGSTVISNATLAGEQVTIGANGIQAAGKSAPLSLPISALNTILGELGITLAVTNATDSVSGPSASRTLDGFRISINLTTLDNVANKFASLLPSKITSQLPIALPNAQVLSLDLGTVSVASDASPAFVAPFSPSTAPASSGTVPTGTFSPTIGSTGTGSSDLGSTGSTGTFGSTGTGGATGTGSTGTTGKGSSAVPLATTPTVFTGIGSGLLLLGLLASGAMAYAYKRTDDASELVGNACAEGDPLGSRFSDDDADELAEFGGPA
jgi:hypothetical protein